MAKEIDKSKIQEGMNEMLRHRIDIIKDNVEDYLKLKKEELSKLTDKDKFEYGKMDIVDAINDFGKGMYWPFANIAASYIQISEYTSQLQGFVNKKIDEVEDYQMNKLEESLK